MRNKCGPGLRYSDSLIFFLVQHVCVPFGDMHQESENKNAVHIRDGVLQRDYLSRLWPCTSSGFLSAQGTVASLSPVAGSDVATGPLLMLKSAYHTPLAQACEGADCFESGGLGSWLIFDKFDANNLVACQRVSPVPRRRHF